jgi:hypothetical protein
MTREQLFRVFPRPCRMSSEVEEVGVVLAADGCEVLAVDTNGTHGDEIANAMAQLLCRLANEAPAS